MRFTFIRYFSAIVAPLLLISLLGCSQSPDQAFGTLEWDRVNSRAPASEIIIDLLVQEGDRVNSGDLTLLSGFMFLSDKIAHCPDYQASQDPAQRSIEFGF